MNLHYVAAATLLGMAACATPGPDTAVPETPVPGAKVETSAKTSTPAVAEGEFEDVDVPEVPEMANIPAQANIPGQTEVVCTREKKTGSHRVTRVCRTRTEIVARRAADQEAIKKIGEGIRK